MLLIIFIFTACGIEEFYYLPQVPQENISVELNSNALIIIPAISSEFYYASGYLIFYRIYLSDVLLETINENNFAKINPSLLSDFNFLSSYTDVTSNTILTTSATFTGRNYYELDYKIEIDFEMNKNGGNLSLNFPPEENAFPTATFTPSDKIQSAAENLKRSVDVIRDSQTNISEPNRYFRNTVELCNNSNAVSAYNADTAPLQNKNPEYAYTAMYIITTGQNPETFTRIYSKPTFIGVFKLPDAN